MFAGGRVSWPLPVLASRVYGCFLVLCPGAPQGSISNDSGF